MHRSWSTLTRAASLLLCGVLLTGVESSGAEPAELPAGLRVFYTGHSFHMFVPQSIEQMVKSAGIQGHKLAGTQGIGGSRVIQHWDLADDKNKARPALTGGSVDVFTMAPHLAIPDEGIAKFTELGLKHNPRLRLLVQASWYPYDVPGDRKIKQNSQRDGMQIAELQAAIDDWRTKIENQVDDLNKQHGSRSVFIIPVGDAVVKLRRQVVEGKYPGITAQSELFTDPIGHAGPHVAALVAYCNFAAIYRHSPKGLSIPVKALDDSHHAILQALAWETVSSYPYAGLAAGAHAVK